MVVYTGDQLKGYISSFSGGANKQVMDTIIKITSPVRRRGIPFAVTFGNHDDQTGVPYNVQKKFYTSIPGCLMPDNGTDPGTYYLTVKDSKGSKDAMTVYMMDTGGGRFGRYKPVTHKQIQWMQDMQKNICKKNGAIVPAIVFQHMPVPEYYDLLIRRSFWKKDAAFGIGKRRGCFMLNKSICRPGGVLSEAPGAPEENSGQFKALKDTEGVFALFCGHDHRNTFSGRLDGIELGYSPSCGFDSYGAGVDRGGRLFVFNEDNPADFETQVFTYRQLVGKYTTRPLRNFIDSVIPANTAELKLTLLNAAFAIAGITAISSAAEKLRKNGFE